MKDTTAPGKAHGGKTIILGNNQIAPGGTVDKCEIDTVRPFVENQGLCVGVLKLMCGIAQDQTGDKMHPANSHSNIHYGTAIGINQYADRNHLRETL